jgi:hypothetical protein
MSVLPIGVLGEWDQKAALDTLAADCGVLQLEDEANAAADVVLCFFRGMVKRVNKKGLPTGL